jgi:hypothetical protein
MHLAWRSPRRAEYRSPRSTGSWTLAPKCFAPTDGAMTDCSCKDLLERTFLQGFARTMPVIIIIPLQGFAREDHPARICSVGRTLRSSRASPCSLPLKERGSCKDLLDHSPPCKDLLGGITLQGVARMITNALQGFARTFRNTLQGFARIVPVKQPVIKKGERRVRVISFVYLLSLIAPVPLWADLSSVTSVGSKGRNPIRIFRQVYLCSSF